MKLIHFKFLCFCGIFCSFFSINTFAQTTVQAGMYEESDLITLKFLPSSNDIPKNHYIQLVFAIKYPVSQGQVTFNLFDNWGDYYYNPLEIEEDFNSWQSAQLNSSQYVYDGYRYHVFAMQNRRRLGTSAGTPGTWDGSTSFLQFSISGGTVTKGDLELVQDDFLLQLTINGGWWFETSPQIGAATTRSNSIDPYYQPKIPATLPVELISLTARQTSQSTQLKWATASETDNKGFEVLRRFENEGEFKQIGFVNGKGNTSQITSYTFEDKQNIYRTAYYRLRQVDFDGTVSNSPIVAVTGRKSNLTSIVTYPNPASDLLHIVADAQVKSLNVAMYSAEGKLVLTKEIKNGEQLPVAHLPQGLYQLIYTTETGETGAGKVVIQK